MRVVLDTNIIVSGIFWTGTPFKILESWQNMQFELILSEDVLFEYSRLLIEFEKKRNFSSNIAKSWILLIAQNSKIIKVSKKVKICRDPFDDMFVSLAIAGKAKYIVSGDKDLLILKNYMSVEVISASKFLGILQNK